jgi:hypothetical protein
LSTTLLPDDSFTPFLLVIHRNRIPRPILPVGDYSFFVHVELPRFTVALPLPSQLLIAKRATNRRRDYPFPGPFREIEAFAFRLSERTTIYLSPEGEFKE